MADDIEEFLRRALQRRVERETPAAKPPREVVYIDDSERIVEARSAEPSATDGHSVSDHVAQHLDSREFSERASHMAERIGNVHNKVEDHLHESFDHKVGDLDDSIASVTDDAPTIASVVGFDPAVLRRMFSNPQTLKQVIVMSEIFNRREI